MTRLTPIIAAAALGLVACGGGNSGGTVSTGSERANCKKALKVMTDLTQALSYGTGDQVGIARSHLAKLNAVVLTDPKSMGLQAEFAGHIKAFMAEKALLARGKGSSRYAKKLLKTSMQNVLGPMVSHCPVSKPAPKPSKGDMGGVWRLDPAGTTAAFKANPTTKDMKPTAQTKSVQVLENVSGSLSLMPDGKAKLSVFGSSDSGTWKKDGKTVIVEFKGALNKVVSTQKCTTRGDELRCTEDNKWKSVSVYKR